MFSNDRPFYIAAGVCFSLALVAMVGSVTQQEFVRGQIDNHTLLSGSVILTLAAAWLFVWPTRIRLQTAPLVDLPAAFQEARNQLADLVTIKKEYNRIRTEMEGHSTQTAELVKQIRERLDQELKTLKDRVGQFDQAVLDLRKAENDKAELRQSHGEAVRRTETWQDCVMEFVGQLERTLEMEQLDDGYRQATAKFAKDLERQFAPLGLRLLRPESGDKFDDLAHESAGEVQSAAGPEGHIANCVGWGYMLGDKVRRKARVQRIAKKPELRTKLVDAPKLENPGLWQPDPKLSHSTSPESD